MNYLFTLKSRVILFALLICQLGLKVQSTAEINTGKMPVRKADIMPTKKAEISLNLKTGATVVIKGVSALAENTNAGAKKSTAVKRSKKRHAAGAKKSSATAHTKKRHTANMAKKGSKVGVKSAAGRLKNNTTVTAAPPVGNLVQVRTTTITPPVDGIIEVRNKAATSGTKSDTLLVKKTDTILAKKTDTTLSAKPDTLVKKTDTSLKRKPDTSAIKVPDARHMQKNWKIEASQIKAEGVFLEIGGPGLAISGNYDARFAKQRNGWGYRAGAGYFGSGGNTVFTVPLQLNYLYGEHNHLLELGAGTTFLNSKGDNKGKIWEFDRITGFIATGTIGYRYQPAAKGLNFRIAFVPILYDQGLMPIGGLSIGYTFK
jgi:hypothetical protein